MVARDRDHVCAKIIAPKGFDQLFGLTFHVVSVDHQEVIFVPETHNELVMREFTYFGYVLTFEAAIAHRLEIVPVIHSEELDAV